ncbi:uncharacterized protein LOC106669005 isoform X2 [Cimex lectularius]|uniref:Peptidase S1 domain-containing protein n=1 Tax=Cimex lectularius TaxID=79782 RepID=A0A8I6S175_CIMLE|nr:uncharacterized protein LOC106669005 isoform X2 [Cimex lectularius]
MKPSNIKSISVVIFLDVTLVFSNAIFAQDDLTMYEPLPGEIPSLISLMSKLDDNRNCVGVLITRWHTMTSCSCLIAPTQAIKESKHVPDRYILVAGITTIVNVKAKGQIRKIKLFVIHPDCEKDGKLVKYDIGIAVSERPFDLGKYVHTVKIPFTLEAHKQSQFFNSMLSQRKSATATLVSWYKANNKNPSLVFVRMNVDQYSAVCKNYTERTNIFRARRRRTQIHVCQFPNGVLPKL